MSIEYRVEGSGPPFVYVCGIEGSGRLFYKQSEDLARDLLLGKVVSEDDRARFREHTRVVGREGYLSRMHIIRDTDLRPRLKEIEVPALVVAGTADRLLDSVAAARLMAASLPRARLKLLEGTGHVALLSDRVRVREWLGEFGEF